MSHPITLKEWIKQRRKALNLTQKEAAAKLSLPPATYRRYEDGSRTTPAPVAQHMARLFGIPPHAQQAFFDLATGIAKTTAVSEPASASVPLSRRGVTVAGLPTSATPFFNREADLADLRRRFLNEQARFITLTGPPGVGKTRLALELAAQLAPYFVGAHVVDLSPVQQSQAVMPAIAQALGVHLTGAPSALDSVVAFVNAQELVLVLDNFEHVLDAAPDITHLVTRCPRLRVLVTSRERLRVRPEQHIRLQPLALPDAGAPMTAATLLAAPATAFFAERARAAGPGFHLDDETAPVVFQICARLDGLPLAIELAAAVCDEMSVRAVWRALDGGLALPSAGLRDLPARQQTLAAAITWSHSLLRPELQRAFASLGVFVGGFEAEAAQALGVTARQLKRLCAKNLAQADGFATEDAAVPAPRYRLLETLREFALTQLKGTSRLDEAREAHALYFAGLVRAAEQMPAGGNDAPTLQRWGANLDNLRAALAWLMGRGTPEVAGTALAMASTLHTFWRQHGLFREGLDWLERALAQCDELSVAPNVLAEAYRRAGYLASQLGLARCVAHLERARQLFAEAGDPMGKARVLTMLGMLARYPGNRQRVEQLLGESLSISRAHGQPSDTMPALYQFVALYLEVVGDGALAERYLTELHAVASQAQSLTYASPTNLGFVRLLQGKLDEAEVHFMQALRDKTNLSKADLAEAYLGLGQVDERRGDFAAAQSYFQHSLDLAAAQGLKFAVAPALVHLGCAAARCGQFEQAAQWLDEGVRLSVEAFHVEHVEHGLVGQAAVAAQHRHDHEQAARLLGAAQAVRQLFQIKHDVCSARLADAVRAQTIAKLGRKYFDELVGSSEQGVRVRIPNVEFDSSLEAHIAINMPAVLAAALGPTSQV